MRISRTTLALIVLNAASLAALGWLVLRGKVQSAAPQVQYVTNYVPILKARSQPLITNVVVAGTNDFRWEQLESEDYRAYIARLRAIGCPEQTIRDIIIADVDKMLSPQMLQASGRTNPIQYWQPIEQELWETAEQREAMRRQREVDFQKREVIRELLGVDLVGERLRLQGQADYHGERLSFLPEEKRARVRLALDHFAEEESALLQQELDGDGSRSGSLAELRQQKEAALAQLLTPEERKQYDLWFSPTAAAVRDSVFGLNASEDEFLGLYELRREFAAQHGESFGPNDPAWGDYQKRIHEKLGGERYAEYARAQDNDYRELLRVASRFKVTPEVISELYSYKEPVTEALTQIEADVTLTPQQKSAAFEAVAQEAQQAFRQALGDKAFRHFMQRSANSWVRGQPSRPSGVARAP